MKKLLIVFGATLFTSTNIFAANNIECKVAAELMKDSIVEEIYKEITIEKGFLHPVYAKPIYLENLGKITDSVLMIGAGGNGNGVIDSDIIRIKLNKGSEELYSGAVFSKDGTFRSVSHTKINGSSLLISIQCK